MSCDYCVLSLPSRLPVNEVAALYQRLCASDTNGVVASPAIDAFYEEITTKHPQIDDVPEDKLDDHDFSPWSIAFDRSPGHLIMCCVWPKADYVGALVLELAKKHGLVVYDPQSNRAIYPDDGPKPWWKIW